MIGLDTNILLRLMLDDDTMQTAMARNAIQGMVSGGVCCFVSHITLVEFVWVMESVFERKREDIAPCLSHLLGNSDFVVEYGNEVVEALAAYQAGFNFSDALIGTHNQHSGCTATFTFDRKAARLPTFQRLT